MHIHNRRGLPGGILKAEKADVERVAETGGAIYARANVCPRAGVILLTPSTRDFGMFHGVKQSFPRRGTFVPGRGTDKRGRFTDKTRHVLPKRHRLLGGELAESKKFYVRRVSAISFLRAREKDG